MASLVPGNCPAALQKSLTYLASQPEGSEAHKAFAVLAAANQSHLLAGWPEEASEEAMAGLMSQTLALDQQYPGGLATCVVRFGGSRGPGGRVRGGGCLLRVGLAGGLTRAWIRLAAMMGT